MWCLFHLLKHYGSGLQLLVLILWTITSLLPLSIQNRNEPWSYRSRLLVQPMSTNREVSVYMPSWSISPKITMLSHHMIGDTIDVAVDSTIHLRCTGQKYLHWSFPNNNHPYETFEQSANMSLTNSCDYDDQDPDIKIDRVKDHILINKCISDVIIYQAQYDMTGYFTCHYNSQSTSTRSIMTEYMSATSLQQGINSDWMDSIFIFVNDPENIIVPYESAKEYLFLALFQSHPATIPCRPTYSTAEVSLWKVHTKDNIPVQIKTNSSLGITYNPKKGFHFDHPRWDSESTVLECRFTVASIQAHAKSTISLHWSILPTELHPMIDDSQAKHVFINDTFTLRCFVHIDIGVIIVVDWDHPSKNNDSEKRILKSLPETSRQLVNNNSYDTVSINITIINATKEDEGLYRCNATDGNGRTFSATKKIVIFDEHLVSIVNFTTDFDDKIPIIKDYGHDVHFTITAYAFPDISFIDLIWYKDGQRLQLNDSHYQMTLYNVFSDSHTQISLYIQSAKPSDSGIYTLVGSTSSSSSSSSSFSSNISFIVYIKGEVDILIDNIMDFYILNQTYKLECKSYGYPITETWWTWHACKTPESCLEVTDSENETQWTNITSSFLMIEDENFAQVRNYWNENQPYLNIVNLTLVAQVSGIYRCSSVLWDGFTSIIRHEDIPFIVMDAEDLFSVTSSTDEPTVNDTIVLTCKASVFRYIQIWWTNTRLEMDNVHPINVDQMVNRTDLTLFNWTNQYSISSTILLDSINLNHSSLYTCEAISRFDNYKTERKDFYLNVKNISPPAILESNMNKEIIEVLYNSQTELKCYIEGRPRPTLEWYRNGLPLAFDGHDSGLQLHDKGQRIVFTRLLEKDSGVYECRASNRGGNVARKVLLQVKGNIEDDFPLQTSEILFIILYFVMGAVIIITAFFFGKRFRDEKLNKREMEFFSKALFDQGQMQLYNPDLPLVEQIDLLPYDSRFEFPKERLILGRTLGQGAFGRVVKAEAIGLENDESVTTVAVKMLKERADANQRKALMAELKILIHLGKHLNIVNLLGVVTKNLVKGELLVIVEYCEFGNLRHYLLANRENYINQLSPFTGKIDKSISNKDHNFYKQIVPYQNVDIIPKSPTSDFSLKIKANDYFLASGGAISYVDLLHRQTSNTTTSSSDYINTNGNGTDDKSSECPQAPLASVAYYNNNYVGFNHKIIHVRPGTSSKTNTSKRPDRFQRQISSISQRRQGRIVTTSDLICWAFQCARGMDYLTMRKLIHRDLAARNVLLASNNVVKICDFGLAKDVYKYDNYVKKDDGPLPIKWMAIESISDKIFTSKSDVWSYGILLWELFTLGKNPYPGIEIDEEFYKRLKNGYRMEKPDFASEDLYHLMLQCWNANPNDRPDFSEIADIVGELLDDKTKKHYIELNNPYLEMNQQILGTNDYLKMTCMTTGESNAFNPDECEYETNIQFLETNNTDTVKNDQHVSPCGTGRDANVIEMSILERSLTKKANGHQMSKLANMNQNDIVVNSIHYDNLTTI